RTRGCPGAWCRSCLARQHVAGGRSPGGGTCPPTGSGCAAGSLGRNHSGKRAHLRRNRGEFHFGGSVDPFSPGGGPAHEDRSGVKGHQLSAVSDQLSALSYQPTPVCGSCPAFVAGVFVVGVIPSDEVAVATEESRDLLFSHLHHRPRS